MAAWRLASLAARLWPRTPRGQILVWESALVGRDYGSRCADPAGPDDPYTSFYGVAWSPDGQRLAGGSYRQEVQMWEVPTGSLRWVARGQPASTRRVAWSQDWMQLASGGDDGIVYLWDASDGTPLKRLLEHRSEVTDPLPVIFL